MPWGNNFFPLLIVSAGGGFTGLFIYSPGPGNGNLILSEAAAAGTDPFGNAYRQGLELFGNSQLLSLTTKDAAEGAPGTLLVGVSGAGPTRQLITQLFSPTPSGQQNATLQLTSTSVDGTIAASSILNRALTAVGGVWALAGVASGTQPAGAEPWNDLGALGAHYTVVLGRYRMRAENEVEIDIKVVGDGLQATSVTFANTLPAAYRPATTHDSLPMGTTRQVTAGDIWPRLTVDTAGNVTVINQGTANTFATCLRIPLD